MRKVFFCFLLCFPASFTIGQPVSEKKILTVEGFAERTIRADEIYFSLSSLRKPALLLRTLDAYLPHDSLRLLPLTGRTRTAAPDFRDGNCAQADSLLSDWLTFYGSGVELVEQELFGEIGMPAANDRFLLKIKGLETFKSLLARLETCPCYIGGLVRVAYSQAETLRHELTLAALRDAKRKAEDMLGLLGHRIKAVYNIAPAQVTWAGGSPSDGENLSPFDPQLNRTAELVCRVRVTVQFRFK